MKRLAIIANGFLKNREFHLGQLRKADCIICADGGANKLLAFGLVPDYLIGDMDSVTKETLETLNKSKKTRIIIDKNQYKTDLEKAIRLANKLKPKEVIILGAIADTIDHTLANLICLNQIDSSVKATIADEKNEIWLVRDSIELSGNKNDIISVIPLTEVKGLSYEGLKWNVTDISVSFGWLGIRNRLIANKCKINLTKGKLLVIKPKW